MSKIKVTQQQRDNLLDALHVMWPSVPEANVAHNLDIWNKEESEKPAHCGTVACFGGWCAHWPAFKAMGVRAGDEGKPTCQEYERPSEVSHLLFGGRFLFVSRGAFPSDIDFTGSDHALVTNRLQWLLDNSEVAE